jgi:hypothetical protein
MEFFRFFRSGTNQGMKKKRGIYIHGVQYTFRTLVIDGVKIRNHGTDRNCAFVSGPVPQGFEVKGFLVDRPS